MKNFPWQVGLDQPIFLIAGPCVIENRDLTFSTAERLKDITERLGVNFIFKSSFDKANRSSISSPRGVGLSLGLEILAEIKQKLGVLVLTDIHEYTPLEEVAEVVDVLQTPAFLCRQTDFLQKVARCGKPVNIKKGQFLAPWEMSNVVKKLEAVGLNDIMVCERGVSFGYQQLIVDMRSLVMMRQTGYPVIFDATHSVQQPGSLGHASGGQREFVPCLARAAIAVGISGLFMETHPDPDSAYSDGPNSWPLDLLEDLLTGLLSLDRSVKERKLWCMD